MFYSVTCVWLIVWIHMSYFGSLLDRVYPQHEKFKFINYSKCNFLRLMYLHTRVLWLEIQEYQELFPNSNGLMIVK